MTTSPQNLVTPPPYRPTNRRGVVGFIISMVCLGLSLIADFCINMSSSFPDVMKVCLLVLFIFILLLSILGLIMSSGAIKKTPKTFAIIGTIVSIIMIVNSILQILSGYFDTYSPSLIY